jgi:hypothetical protein
MSWLAFVAYLLLQKRAGGELEGLKMTSMHDDEARLQRLVELDREERALVAQALGGDRAAFDRLFDRYFDRMVHRFRNLPEGEAQERVADALSRLFADLSAEDTMPLASRAHEVAVQARPRRAPVRVRHATQPTASTPAG